ncbi:2-dehydro-3-deoxygluconokinase [Aquimarina aggregata]|uniref:2-dehydro-3-deoxygluconokinase n=1 Tax=Aquimarina aggregata TaxID=1642818 RepID=A0A162FDJ2_9FLAO|nr:sugar kinase [Aquimarina aggregata]KZS41676.1 2-dehydro-3-deoxygluconokinase [Aquimarina aggregata]
MNKVVTFGEVLMRIAPLGNKKLKQTNQLEYYFGGTEANVAISLSQFGNQTQHVGAVSNDFVGDAAKSFLQKFGVNTSAIHNSHHPLGLYFLEVGAVMRSSTIAYNRAHSAFSNIDPKKINWEEILKDCQWFHWTGITPALSLNAYQALKEGLTVANQKGIPISADPAYRKDLWNYGKDAKKILNELVGLSTIFIGGPNEINELLSTKFSYENDDFIKGSKLLLKKHTNIQKVFDKTRKSINANWHKIQARMWNGLEFLETNELEITHVIDRIGTGDAYAAGLIHGLLHYDDTKALKFANASCAIKHTIEGDANLVTEQEVISIIEGNLSGRIIR